MPRPKPRATAECHCLPFDRFSVEAASRSHCGRVRTRNEDCACVAVPSQTEILNAKGVLAVVADGMGGHRGGELASSIAVERVRAQYYASRSNPGQALKAAFDAANREVFDYALRHPNVAGMGTTCTAAVVVNGLAWMAHVGDSRIYLVRDGGAYRMTEDHSATMDLVTRGLLTLAEAGRHEARNIILRALGTRDRLEPATWKDAFPLRPGDRLLLCSDGLYENLSDTELAEICGRPEGTANICDTLLETALGRGGTDNITAAVLWVRPAAKEAAGWTT